MSITDFGHVGDQSVQEIKLRGACGTEASVITYGAILRDLIVPVGGGKRRVVLGYRSLHGYLDGRAYIGATVGRCINRINRGFTLDGKHYTLPVNEGDHVHLHGGPNGFSKRVWRLVGCTDKAVTIEITSPDGDEGYPGALTARCTYAIDSPGTLSVELTATCDAPTVCNLGHHSYFTLQPGSDVRDHKMMVAAGFYTPLDQALIPTGEIRKVADTIYDFRTMRTIRADHGPGYDINFVLDQGWLPHAAATELPVAARLVSPNGDLAMDLSTTEPGLQFYEGIRLSPSSDAYEGEPHLPYRGLCLEPQRFPDSINRAHFSPIVLRPAETYRQVTRFRFSQTSA
ncbi:aldose epimerase family protein [Dongia deserti]|uniref:aldose epimerase family protein n=1 Tax=Dongia deserti TaxID=2268030 RepID=UPI000E6529F4|nr:aldose epimerase family protein [Dongia deserti]